MKKLVIVESPAKAKTIQKYLGKEYRVLSSKGHVSDLPKSQLGVDVEKEYTPTYEVTKPSVVKELKRAMKTVDVLVLAVDPDREGEAIGWHVARELGVIDVHGKQKPKKTPVERIVFTEITKDAVQNAAANPRKIDMDLVNAQQARRVLDRLVGYKLSPLLWKKIRYGLSAGRVQSVAVRLIVDRERERDAFKAEEYWSVHAFLNTKPASQKLTRTIFDSELSEEQREKLKLEIDKVAKNTIPFELVAVDGKKPKVIPAKQATSILEGLTEKAWQVSAVDKKTVSKNPLPPFTTSLLQQAAVNRLGFTAKRTMQVAQKLYEAGHITYMRTDSYHLSPQAINSMRKYIQAAHGDKYVPEKPRFYANRSKVAQEAHEAIRPTYADKRVADLKLQGDEARLYDLIWRRAVASQMSPAQVEQQKLSAVTDKYTFQANGRVTLFPGYLAVYVDNTGDVELPKLAIGDNLYPHALSADQHFTQPPARFSEATLVKELERLGIGRPSTYAPIIQTIVSRKYVEKEGKYFKPTDTGIVVTDLLVKHFQDIVDVGFTASMEDDLDSVAGGTKEWVKMLDQFYQPFAKQLKQKEKSIDKEDFTVLGKSDEKCPECGKPMVIKLGKFGRFLSCSNFPDCKGMLPIATGTEGESGAAETAANLADTYMPAPKTEDGRGYVLKRGRFGEFWAHPDYPKVKDAQPLQLKPEIIVERYGKPPQTDDKRDYILKQGKFGPFWAHPDYPKVKDIVAIKKPAKKATKKRR